MSITDLISILPLLVLSTAIVALMLVIAFLRNHTLTVFLTILSLALAVLSLVFSPHFKSVHITSLLIIDGYSLFYMGVIFIAGLFVVILTAGYMDHRSEIKEEMYIFILIATLGSAVVVSSSHFASLFLGIELLSVSLFVMIGYLRSRATNIEASIKYLVTASVSMAILLFGLSLVYAAAGSMDFSQVAAYMKNNEPNVLLTAGFALVLVGFGFKLALVPFHFWAADIYQGASAPITGFIAGISKVAVFAAMLRLSLVTALTTYRPFFIAFAVAAVLSMFAGNFLALLQTSVKRILAYSSIANMGYLLVAFLAGGSLATRAVAFYLLGYFITILAAFGVISVFSAGNEDLDDINDFRGLAFKRPWFGGILTVALLSLAGMPLTIGFIGKFYIIYAGASSQLWLLLIILAINTLIGLYYYLRIIWVMYSSATEVKFTWAMLPPRPLLASGLVLAILIVALVWLGVYPSPVIRLIESTTGLVTLAY